MALQQRLHRGEVDHNDKLLAASHDELKRKMELSAKGIFEEQAPNGKEPALKVEGRQPAPSHTPSRPSSVASVASSVPTSPTPALLESAEDGRTEASEAGTDDSDVDAELPRHRLDETDGRELLKPPEPFMPQASHHPAPLIMPSIYTPFEQAAYSQTQTTVTTQTFAFSNAPSEPHTTQFFLTQPRFTNQRYHNQHIWQSQPEHGPVLQPWTSQMFQALPSNPTPAPSAREVLTTTNHPIVEEQHDDVFDPFGPSSNTDAYGCPRSSLLLSDDASSPEQPQLAVLRAKVNIFTRQARENGVIGGNNNYLDPGGEGGRRRNMFDNRA
ncbi:MAG: hypothetical protein Q9198_006470 [Flavoplaca austrocitrina]